MSSRPAEGKTRRRAHLFLQGALLLIVVLAVIVIAGTDGGSYGEAPGPEPEPDPEEEEDRGWIVYMALAGGLVLAGIIAVGTVVYVRRKD